MVLDRRDFPPDNRVEQEARHLIAQGHEVVLVCERGPGRPERELYQGIRVFRLAPLPRGLHKLQKILFPLSFVDFRWLVALRRLGREHACEVFHVHDLPMARTALRAARPLACRVVLDFHENFPVALQDFRSHSPKRVDALARRYYCNLSRWRAYERRVARQADRIVVVVEESRRRISALGVPDEKITVVSNTLHERFTADPATLEEVASRFAGFFVLSYIGSLAHYRRVDTAIRAMPAILSRVPRALLLVVGRVDERPDLQALAAEVGVKQRVAFVGWQPFDRVPAYVAASDVGVLPHVPNDHTNSTVPHKLFHYMFLERPVIVSECVPLARIVSECGCGRVVEGLATHPARLAAAVVASFENPGERAEMGRRGRQAVLERYLWSREADRLASMYAGLGREVATG